MCLTTLCSLGLWHVLPHHGWRDCVSGLVPRPGDVGRGMQAAAVDSLRTGGGASRFSSAL